MKKQIVALLSYLLTPMLATAGTFVPFADALIWYASEQVTANYAGVISFSNNSTDFKASNIKFDYKPGVRAGIAYIPDNQLLDLSFYWTNFNTRTSNRIPLGSGIVNSDFFSGSFFISKDLFFGGNLQWKLLMNSFDLEVGHHFKPIESVDLHPKLGIKTGFINQTIQADWNAIIFKANERLTHDFKGVGPSIGIDGKWNLYQSLSFTGNFSMALLWGTWDVKDTYQRPAVFLLFPTPTTITTSMNNAKLGTLMLDYFVGLEWSQIGRTEIAVRAGYEMQYWGNQLRLTAVQQLPTHGDLTFQGATCGISIKV